MEIKTKYNIGDTVYHLEDNLQTPKYLKNEEEAEPYKVKIVKMGINFTADGTTYSVRYVLDKMPAGSFQGIRECDLYSSVEEYNSRYEPLLKEAIEKNDAYSIIKYASILHKKIKVIVEEQ